jgi:hypothetical protein
MLNSIQLEQLTKTMQEAMKTTLRLGYQYLWIDSLCIIQDSRADWDREAAVMDQVYARSICTIAATGAAKGSEGLFFQREVSLVRPRRIQVTLDQERRSYYFADNQLWHNEVQAAPLNERAWVLQEMMLSPRTIHFARNQVFWTCQQYQKCESVPGNWLTDPCSRPSFMIYSTIAYWKACAEIGEQLMNQRPRDLVKANTLIVSVGSASIETIIANEDNQELVQNVLSPPRRDSIINEMWRQVVENYSRRQLTRSGDRIPAIQGLANEFQRQFDDKYIAGFWQNDLLIQLLWMPSEHRVLRPAFFKAPSWSWLSCEKPVSCFWDNIGMPASKVEIIHTFVTTERADSGDNIFRGFVRLQGRLARALIHTFEHLSESRSLFTFVAENIAIGRSVPKLLFPSGIQLFGSGSISQDSIEVSLDYFNPSSGGTEVYILQLIGRGTSWDHNTPYAMGLVLERVGTKAEFIQSGMFFSDEKSLAAIVRAFDAFDRSSLSETLPYKVKEGSKLYEIALI